MRVSVIKGDPGFRPDAYECEAILNGIKMDDCFTADEEKGIAYCWLRDAEGKFVLSDDETEIKTIKLYGQVRIDAPDGFFDNCGAET